MARKPSVLSAAGIAATILIGFVVVLTLDGSPDAQAAAIVRQLDEQLNRDTLFEVRLESLSIEEEIVLDGTLQVWGENAAGEIVVSAHPREVEIPIVADLRFAIPRSGGWILFNEVSVEDPEVQALIDWFLTPGAPTLVMLPEGVDLSDLGSNVVTDVLDLLRSGHFYQVLEAVIDSRADHGARIRTQADGSMLLSLPVDDIEAAAALERLVDRFMPSRTMSTVEIAGEQIEIPGHMTEDERETLRLRLERLSEGKVTLGPAGVEVYGRTVSELLEESGVAMSGDVASEPRHYDGDRNLVGSTIEVAYDPDAERVLSFTIEDFGATRGTMAVTIGRNEIEADLLDPGRAGGASARRVSFKVFQGMIAALEKMLD